MSAPAHCQPGIIDWPAKWDSLNFECDEQDVKTRRALARRAREQLQVIDTALHNRRNHFGPQSVRDMLARLLDSSTVIHGLRAVAAKLPEDELGIIFETANDIPPGITVVDTEPGVLLENFIHVGCENGLWVHAHEIDCWMVAARFLIRQIVEEIAGPELPSAT